MYFQDEEKQIFFLKRQTIENVFEKPHDIPNYRH
jgi:hypothetical protein